MNLSRLAKTADKLSKTTKKNSPELCIGAGIASFIAAIILVAKEAPKVEKEVEEAKKEENVEKLPPLETIKIYGTHYAKPALCVLAGSGLIFNSYRILNHRIGILMTSAAAYETLAKDYKEAAIETVGAKKEAMIQEKADEKAIARAQEQGICAYLGPTLFYDPYSGRLFYHDINKVERAITKICRILSMGEDSVATMNDLYVHLDLETIKMGDGFIWENPTDGRMDEIRLLPRSCVLSSGEAARILEFNIPPKVPNSFRRRW